MIFKKLSDWGIGPKCFYYDETCRIEQFLAEGRHPTNKHLESL
jgi:hypothetical protein